MLWNWTGQGIRNAKYAPQRYESFKKDLERAGAKSKVHIIRWASSNENHISYSKPRQYLN
jgi:uncharacterized protein with GYD domain